MPVEAVIGELDSWLKTNGNADYVTLSGSGEPTLHSGFGEVLRFIRSHSSIPAVLLTNGTLLYYVADDRESGADHDKPESTVSIS